MGQSDVGVPELTPRRRRRDRGGHARSQAAGLQSSGGAGMGGAVSDIGLIESPLGIRWTTLAMAAAIIVVVGIRRRPFVGVVTVAAWMTAFEIPFQLADALVHHRDAHLAHTLAVQAFWLVTMAGWIGWAHALGVRPDTRWSALSAAIFAVWVAQGFPYNWAGQQGPVQWWPELLNAGSKTALGVAYLRGAVASPLATTILPILPPAAKRS